MKYLMKSKEFNEFFELNLKNNWVEGDDQHLQERMREWERQDFILIHKDKKVINVVILKAYLVRMKITDFSW